MRSLRVAILSLFLTPAIFGIAGVLEVKAQSVPVIDTQYVCVGTSEITFRIKGVVCQSGYDAVFVDGGVSVNDPRVCVSDEGSLVNPYQCNTGDIIQIGPAPNGGSTSGSGTSATITALCANKDYTKVAMPGTGGKCAQDYEKITGLSIPSSDKSVCVLEYVVGQKGTGFKIKEYLPEDSKCKNYINTLVPNPRVVTISQAIGSTPQEEEKGSKSNKSTNPKTPGSTQVECPQGFQKSGPVCVPENPFANSQGVAGAKSLTDVALIVIRAFLWAAGITAVIMIMFGGYQWLTAASNESRRTNGRKTLTNALIGFIFVVMAYGIITLLKNILTKGV